MVLTYSAFPDQVEEITLCVLKITLTSLKSHFKVSLCLVLSVYITLYIYMFHDLYMCIFSLLLYICLRGRERGLSSASLLHKCQEWQGLGKADAERQELNPGLPCGWLIKSSLLPARFAYTGR